MVWFLIFAFFIIAFPFGKLLDKILGAEGAKFYNRGELKRFVELHGEEAKQDKVRKQGDGE
jgi:hypothetical protein